MIPSRGGVAAAARFSVEPSSIRVPLRLWLETKVRSAVVASWVLARLSPLCIGLIHEGRDYRGDPAGLAGRIDAWTTDLPDGTPSDPPSDPRFVKRIQKARENLKAGKGRRLEDVRKG